LLSIEGMDLRTGNFGDELWGFLDFWRGRKRSRWNRKNLKLGMDQSRSRNELWFVFLDHETVFRCLVEKEGEI
jgi:hypothetical protein